MPNLLEVQTELIRKIQVELVLSPSKSKKNICKVIKRYFSNYFATSCYLKSVCRNSFVKIYKIETSRQMLLCELS